MIRRYHEQSQTGDIVIVVLECYADKEKGMKLGERSSRLTEIFLRSAIKVNVVAFCLLTSQDLETIWSRVWR